VRYFTNTQLTRGIEAVLDTDGFGMRTAADWRAIFLEAAEEPPIVHPMHCPVCRRPLTDAQGVALVGIRISDHQWTCGTCEPAAERDAAVH
jgi:hypothetical protein